MLKIVTLQVTLWQLKHIVFWLKISNPQSLNFVCLRMWRNLIAFIELLMSSSVSEYAKF